MGGGGGGGGGGCEGRVMEGMNIRTAIFCLHDSSTEPYNFMKIILRVFKI